MRKEIITIFKESKKPLDALEIKKLLQIRTSNNDKIMLKTLVELQNENIIEINNNHKFYYLDKKKYLRGIISINKKGFGFVKIADGQKEYYISKKNMKTALNNDEVLFQLKLNYKQKDKKNTEGKIIKIIKRNNKFVIGIVKKNHLNNMYLYIMNNKLQQYKTNIMNPNQCHKEKIVRGVIVNIDESTNILQIKVLETLGNIDQLGMDILSVIYEFNIPNKFSTNVLNETNKIEEKINKEKITKTRHNLIDKLLVTIDDNDAKDFDDAIYIEKTPNNTFKLYVAISDVAHYVIEKSWLDKEAFNRGCSVYLIDRVIPMLPERLSNGICSLSPNELRFVMCCEMEFDEKGNVINSNIYEAVIKSHARLTYNIVNKLFNNGQQPEINANITKMLYQARKLYKILANKKYIEGIVNFDINEPKFITNSSGKIIDVKIRTRNEAEKLIEYFMIITNETVAKKIYLMGLPFIYRIHKKPQEKKLYDLYNQLSLLGLNIENKLKNIHSKDLQQILEKAKDKDNFKVISTLFLRSMEKAKYSSVNDGHFGLVSTSYTHFTSPIRRYPDLIVHRLLKKYINTKLVKKYYELTAIISEQSSNCEIRAMECEREVNNLKEAEFMEDKVGQIYEGIISGVTSFGIFVELPNTIEGLVHISNLNDDYYIFDKKTISLTGERKKQKYFLGKKVKIKVKKASKELRQIDFILVT